MSRLTLMCTNQASLYCPTYITHTSALQFRDYCAIYDPPPTPHVHAMHHTILIMKISCTGQLRGRSNQSINQSKVLTKPHTGRGEATSRVNPVGGEYGNV